MYPVRNSSRNPRLNFFTKKKPLEESQKELLNKPLEESQKRFLEESQKELLEEPWKQIVDYCGENTV